VRCILEDMKAVVANGPEASLCARACRAVTAPRGEEHAVRAEVVEVVACACHGIRDWEGMRHENFAGFFKDDGSSDLLVASDDVHSAAGIDRATHAASMCSTAVE